MSICSTTLMQRVFDKGVVLGLVNALVQAVTSARDAVLLGHNEAAQKRATAACAYLTQACA